MHRPLPGGRGSVLAVAVRSGSSRQTLKSSRAHAILISFLLLLLLLPAAARQTLADGTSTLRPWGKVDEGGGGNLVVAGPAHASVCTDREKVWSRLQDRMAASPEEPAPALDLAEVAFRSGELEQAAEVLEEAIRRTGGLTTIADPDLKRRIFEDCITFAQSAGKGTGTVGLQERLLVLAARCPPDPDAHLRYLIPLAKLYEKTTRPALAVELYQRVIADESLRSRSCGGCGSERLAGEYCIERIDELIGLGGREIYGQFDAQAGELLEAGKKAGDLQMLDDVIRFYPNATVVRDAHIARGSLLESTGRRMRAVRAYYHAYAAYPAATNSPSRAELLARIAACFRSAGRNDLAARWLRKARSLFPKTSLHVNGSASWDALADALGVRIESAHIPVPQLTLPLTRRFERRYAKSVTLLTPVLSPTYASSYRLCFLYTSEGIVALDAAANELVWTKAAGCKEQPVLLCATAEYAVFAAPHEIFACAVSDGKRMWTVGGHPERLDDPATDPENFPAYRYYASDGRRLVAFRNDNYVVCVEMAGGNVLWKNTVKYAPVGRVVLDGERLVYAAHKLGRSLCCVVDARTGSTVAAFSLTVDAAVDRLLPVGAGLVLGVTSGGLLAYDIESGEQLWTFSSSLTASGVVVDVDGVYLVGGGGRVIKLRWSDGFSLWETMLPVVYSGSGLSLSERDGRVFVATDDRFVVLNSEDGRVILAPDAPPDARVVSSFIADRYLVSVRDSQDDNEPAAYYIYDYLSGDREPAVGGWGLLGPFENLRSVLLCDDALVIQDGRRIFGVAIASANVKR